MQIFKPAYYDSFHCIADQCPDSCCKEWEVQVDEQTAATYRALPGELGQQLRHFLVDDPEWGTVMRLQDGRCPMWRPDGLCRIQAELGHSALCKTCQDFPRLRHDYGSFAQLQLELSCPEAARIILSAPAATMLTEERPGGEVPDYDPADMDILLRTRQVALDFLANTDFSVPQALALLLLYGYQAQGILDGAEEPPFAPTVALDAAAALANHATPLNFSNFFAKLEILTPQWNRRLTEPASNGPWQGQYRNLASYFVERYWLQAISDYDLVSRVKFAVISCLLIHSLGGDFLSTAQLYSKEIENSTENVEAILDGAYTEPAFTDQRLLAQLLG